MELEQELRDHLRQFDPPPEPRATDDEIVADLRALEDASPHEPPRFTEVAEVAEERRRSGSFTITYTEAIVRRNEANQISEIVEAHSRTIFERDADGIVTGFTKVTEAEEVEEPDE